MKRGETVELRSPAEILATLDDEGTLDGMPFMSEMLQFFGRTFTVEARADRACDTIEYTGVRNPRDTVLLDDLRCSGGGHGGCQAQCRIYWKEAWLRRASADGPSADPREDPAFPELERRATANARAPASTADTPLFRCQATELLRASEPVGWWDPRSFVRELTGGNVGFWKFARVMVCIVAEEIGRRLRVLRRTAHPFVPKGPIEPVSSPEPSGLRVGQLVQIRRGDEIRPTLDSRGKNKGLWFDREMKVYCGQTARVKARVERFIDERSGRMIELATDAYILEDVVCQSYRSDGRWFCPRAIYPWWREAWLEPVAEAENRGR
jgi:hypothetical protein